MPASELRTTGVYDQGRSNRERLPAAVTHVYRPALRSKAGKGMFSQASVILVNNWLVRPPLRPDTPPPGQTHYYPPGQTHQSPGQTGYPPLPPDRHTTPRPDNHPPTRHTATIRRATVKRRSVHILLECILVCLEMKNAICVVGESCDDLDCANVECEGAVTVTGHRPLCYCDCEDGKYNVKPSFYPQIVRLCLLPAKLKVLFSQACVILSTYGWRAGGSWQGAV